MNLDPGFTTEEMARLFSPESRVDRFCRFEAALAGAQAELGEIPEEAAAAIAGACSTPVTDPAGVLARGWEEGTPVLVLLHELRARMDEEHASHLHKGATTQDVVDTALMLQSREGFSILDRSLAAMAADLAVLAEAHRGTPTLGRTFLQAALPTSFGARAALWLRAVVDTRRDLRAVEGRLPLQLGGPVGDAASYGPSAFTLAERLAERLGLAAPVAPWHTDRAPVRDTAGVLGGAASVCSKIASDVSLLSAWGEVRVRAGRSSSMTHKRNPIDALRAAAAAEVCWTAVAGVVSAPPHALERGAGPWHAEWALVPLAFQSAGAAAEAMARCLASLAVKDPDPTAGTAPPSDNGLIDRVLEQHRALEAGE